MPEIAEVRWLVKNLQKEILGVEFHSAVVSHPGVMEYAEGNSFPNAAAATSFFNKQLEHAAFGDRHSYFKVSEVDRRGKFLLITLTADAPNETRVILSHLGFTGWWVPSWAEYSSPKRFLHPVDLDHTKILIETSKGKLHIPDPRVLSNLRFYPDKKSALESRHLINMGPDADTDEGILTLIKTLPKTGRRIRDVIMDQQVACGIGNYLACEILHRAKLHGHEKAKTITSDERVRLTDAIRSVILQACTEDSHDWWSVFRLKKCPLGHEVTREDWGRRGHYLCYTCQGKPTT